MSLCRRGSSGYRGIRERRSGVYYVEIRSGDVRLGLGTFETSHEATSAYDAAAWRLGRPRAWMNFQDVHTHEQAHDLAPSPRLITDQDREEHRRRQRRLLVVEEDERAMAEWRRRHLEDVATENAFWAERTTRRHEERDDRLMTHKYRGSIVVLSITQRGAEGSDKWFSARKYLHALKLSVTSDCVVR